MSRDYGEENSALLELSVDQAQAVDRACDHFEASWRAGLGPRIEGFLDAVVPAVRPALLSELLPLELELRFERGDHPCEAEYADRFPEHVEQIRKLLPPCRVGEPATGPDPEDDPDPPGPSDTALVGSRVGRYLILDRIAEDPTGVVHRARGHGSREVVALQLIGPDRAPGSWGILRESTLEGILAEARAASRLTHPNILPVLDLGLIRGRAFIASKLVRGRWLDEVSMTYPPDSRRAAAWIRSIADAIRSAHERGMTHRALRPANVLIDEEGRPLLTGFGLATLEESSPSRSDAYRAALPYKAPEQVDLQDTREASGPRSDLYGLGATLYYILTGRPPFRAPTPAELVEQILRRRPVPPRWLNPAVPRALETICLNCLAKSPGRRYADAGEVVEELDRFLCGQPLRKRRAGIFQRLSRGLRTVPARRSKPI